MQTLAFGMGRLGEPRSGEKKAKWIMKERCKHMVVERTEKGRTSMLNFQATLRFSIIVSAACLTLALPLSAQTLKADYKFDGNFDSIVAGAPSLVLGAGSGSFGTTVIRTGITNTIYSFVSGTDLRLNSTGLIPTNEYSVAMLFKLNANANRYKTILDVRDPIIDDHLYIDPSGNLNWPSIVASPPHLLTNGGYYTLVLTRNASDNKLRGYLNGALDFSLTDSNSHGDLSASQIIHFFKDDGGSEQTSGSVARIQL